MDAIGRGLSSKQIARILGGISPRTVQTHRRRAMRRLGVRDMAGLMRLAAQRRGHAQTPASTHRPAGAMHAEYAIGGISAASAEQQGGGAP